MTTQTRNMVDKEMKQLKQYKTIYIVRYINAYGYIETKMVQKSTLDRYIKNWGWQCNGDKSGLEIIEHTFETMFNPKILDEE